MKKNHDSLHINPLFTNVFKNEEFAEKFDKGIQKMLNACKVDGNILGTIVADCGAFCF